VSRHTTPATTGTADIWEKLADPVQQHLPQQEIQRRGLSVQVTNWTNSDVLKIGTLVQQIMTELSEAGSRKKQNNGHYKNGT
jgi:hypothetical protein